MKTKATLIAVLFAAAGTTFASGGRDINNIDVSKIQPTKVEITEIQAQGPIDAFNVKVDNETKVNTAKFKQSYDDVSYKSLEDVL